MDAEAHAAHSDVQLHDALAQLEQYRQRAVDLELQLEEVRCESARIHELLVCAQRLSDVLQGKAAAAAAEAQEAVAEAEARARQLEHKLQRMAALRAAAAAELQEQTERRRADTEAAGAQVREAQHSQQAAADAYARLALEHAARQAQLKGCLCEAERRLEASEARRDEEAQQARLVSQQQAGTIEHLQHRLHYALERLDASEAAQRGTVDELRVAQVGRAGEGKRDGLFALQSGPAVQRC